MNALTSPETHNAKQNSNVHIGHTVDSRGQATIIG